MSAFDGIFRSTSAFLRAKGISAELSKGKTAARSAKDKFEKQTGVALPESFSAFFTDFADGGNFWWEMSEEQWGSFAMPSLKELAEEHRDWNRYVHSFLDDPQSLDRCTRAQFRDAAFGIWRTMLSWIPFWDEGNGDHFCVDTATGKIVYDQHDWYDGFGLLAKTNGIVAGENLADFLQKWSLFCFQPPKSFWWGKFREFGAVRWEPQFFNREFFRGS